ncbi:VOC family protein [Emcibacter sp. SYSU 3D8]|uniref:VOC family protein n=1 Tax=Emcibacter sp. SYSU 3D8 TaxID=3133969 RepID=UPI0031FE5701
MIDHFSLPVSDLQRSKPFYVAVLGALGYLSLRADVFDGYAAFGFGDDPDGEPPFWIGGPTAEGVPGPQISFGQHIAFTARSRDLVDAFHAAGLAAGGADNGPPGLRPQYHQDYYAAFLLDPDGHHIEAVCHRPA